MIGYRSVIIISTGNIGRVQYRDGAYDCVDLEGIIWRGTEVDMESLFNIFGVRILSIPVSVLEDISLLDNTIGGIASFDDTIMRRAGCR